MLFLCLNVGAQQYQHTGAKPVFIELIENKGQFNKNIKFRGQASCFDLHIGSDYINYYFLNKTTWANAVKHPNQGKLVDSIDVFALNMQFLNSNKNAVVQGKDKQAHYYNFYWGKDAANWASNVFVYKAALITQLYKGIHFKYLAGKQLKYEFYVEPNANINDIKIAINGAKDISIEYGALFITTPFETIREEKPYAYQIINGKKINVEVNFALHNNVLSYNAPNGYNKNYVLVIDPSLVFLTYSGSTVDNFGFTATPGENGTLYAGGIATGPFTINPTGTYPTNTGSFIQIFRGGRNDRLTEVEEFPCDITLSKYNSNGTTLLWSTYFGGATANEYPHSLVIDKDSNLIVLGTTSSSDFPVTADAFDTSFNGSLDIVVFKFNKDGTTLIGSTYIGGSANDGVNYNGVTNFFYADGFRGDIISDNQQKIYVASVTNSNNFPVTAGAIGTNLQGTQDGAVLCLNNKLTALEWSTYFGGNGVEGLYSIDISSNGDIYLAGGTSSTNLAGTNGSIQSTNGGGTADGFVAVIKGNGQQVLKTTYWGTNNYDQIFSLELDENENVYVVGHSLGNMPIKGNVYKNQNGRQFITCFNKDLNNTLWSTIFGGGRSSIDLTINAFLVDECGRIYVTGWGGNTSSSQNFLNSSTRGLVVTKGAFQDTTDGSDFYLMVLNRGAVSLLYATYLGGDENTGDHVDGGTSRFDKRGVVYQSLCASCPAGLPLTPISDLQTTANSFAPINVSPRCSNAALKFDFRIENAAFDFTIDTCAGIFKFKNNTKDAFSFYWVFPDGDTSTLENPEKFIAPKYLGDSVTLIVEFGTNCADTAYGVVSLPDTALTLEIPNAFTPNGDNFNDEYQIKGINNRCDDVEAFIYNRWGQIYFTSNQPGFAWNGKSTQGIDAPEGVYFLILTIKKHNGQIINHHSTITLIR